MQVRSLKKYSVEAYTNALRKINFPNYDTFSNVNVAYTNLVKKISNTIDSVAPIKELRIKNNTQGWLIMKLRMLSKKETNILRNSRSQIYILIIISTLKQNTM